MLNVDFKVERNRSTLVIRELFGANISVARMTNVIRYSSVYGSLRTPQLPILLIIYYEACVGVIFMLYSV